MNKIAFPLLALGLVTDAAHAQDTPDGPDTRLWALPATACVANTPTDEAVLRRSIEGLRNTSATRTVWVTCSVPMPNLVVPPNDDIRVVRTRMSFATSLSRATMPCKAAVNIGAPGIDFVYFWGQATTNTESRAGSVQIETNTGRFTASVFGITCKIPQSSTLTELEVLVRATNFIQIE
jgi:hypothetical protein